MTLLPGTRKAVGRVRTLLIKNIDDDVMRGSSEVLVVRDAIGYRQLQFMMVW
jgi:hypothetical protein